MGRGNVFSKAAPLDEGAVDKCREGVDAVEVTLKQEGASSVHLGEAELDGAGKNDLALVGGIEFEVAGVVVEGEVEEDVVGTKIDLWHEIGVLCVVGVVGPVFFFEVKVELVEVVDLGVLELELCEFVKTLAVADDKDFLHGEQNCGAKIRTNLLRILVE